MLELKNIKKSFGGTEVLKNVGLSVAKGDVVAILGPSGSGKTTLLRIANFLETADGGEMNFEGEVLDLPKVSHRGCGPHPPQDGFCLSELQPLSQPHRTRKRHRGAARRTQAFRCRGRTHRAGMS